MEYDGGQCCGMDHDGGYEREPLIAVEWRSLLVVVLELNMVGATVVTVIGWNTRGNVGMILRNKGILVIVVMIVG